MFEELNTDDQETDRKDTSNGKAFLAFMAILVPLYLLVNHFWGGDIALTAYFCLATNMIAIGICWDLSKHIWFWVLIVLLLGLHVPLVLMVKWPHYWIPGIALLPIGLVDLGITVGIVRFIEKFVVRYVPPDQEQ